MNSQHKPLNMNTIVGSHHILLITLDSLRYDVAQQAWEDGVIPNLAKYLPSTGWEKRHTPGNFTFPAHQAFFAGFLPTPARPGLHPRLFATRFLGATTPVDETFIFDDANIVSGLQGQGYYTLCIGGVGFFNKKSPLTSTFTTMFDESYWRESFGVTAFDSTQTQVDFAIERIKKIAADKTSTDRIFLFINISAIHQPNYIYLENPDHTAREDTVESQRAALIYVDSQLPKLFDEVAGYGPLFCVLCSDHGDAYGEDGFYGHQLNHDVVLTVPYAQFLHQM